MFNFWGLTTQPTDPTCCVCNRVGVCVCVSEYKTNQKSNLKLTVIAFVVLDERNARLTRTKRCRKWRIHQLCVWKNRAFVISVARQEAHLLLQRSARTQVNQAPTEALLRVYERCGQLVSNNPGWVPAGYWAIIKQIFLSKAGWHGWNSDEISNFEGRKAYFVILFSTQPALFLSPDSFSQYKPGAESHSGVNAGMSRKI